MCKGTQHLLSVFAPRLCYLLFDGPGTVDVLPLAYDAIMQTSTEVYRQLKAAEFSEPQTRAFIEILQTAGVIEPEPPESELERIERYLLAEPFQPFVIGMAGG